jgi:WD40 repeat protein
VSNETTISSPTTSFSIQAISVLGQTADGTGLYLLPRGQDPSFDHVLQVSLATGETTGELSISGDPYAGLSPDGRFILTTVPQDILRLYALTAVHPSRREVVLPDSPSHTRNLLWTTNGSMYFSLLAGNFYDYDPSSPPAALGLWRLDLGTGKLCWVTRRDGRTLVTGDLQGSVLVWDADTGQVTADIQVSQGELNASGLSPDEQWLLLRHFPQDDAVLVHLATGTLDSFTLPALATFVGWR